MFLSGCSAQQPANVLFGNTNETNLLNPDLQLTVKADKSIYRSYEKINLSVELLSDQNLQDVFIEAKGITSRLKRDYFNQTKIIDLPKQTNQEIVFTQTLPSCNSCSGLSPGNYSITVSVTYQNKIIATKSINLKIKQ